MLLTMNFNCDAHGTRMNWWQSALVAMLLKKLQRMSVTKNPKEDPSHFLQESCSNGLISSQMITVKKTATGRSRQSIEM